VSSSCPHCRKLSARDEERTVPARAHLARSIARVEAATLPWRPSLPELHPRAWLARLAPTRRSLALGFGILAVALGGYLLARETPMFAIDRIEVRGGSPHVARQVHSVLASFVGRSLVGLDGSAVLQRVDALPTVVSASYDRGFPHTLHVVIVPERAAAVLRRGPDSWLVSTRGRVMERLPATAVPRLPRIWISMRTPVRAGEGLGAGGAATAARAVGLAGGFRALIDSASFTDGTVVFRLRSGLEVILGDPGDIRLKVAVAARALGVLPPGSSFLDVSIPGRPVSGYGSPTTTAPPTRSSRG
jgi:hypothetical protein